MAEKSSGLFWWRTVSVMIMLLLGSVTVHAVPLPGGTLDPLTVPKYVQPLVIPPVMPGSAQGGVLQNPDADYNIAVRQFQQQILPGGVWNSVNGRSDAFGATTLWSYGRAEDTIPANFVAPVPLTNGVSFNYPAFTVETTSNVENTVRWLNDLVADPATCAASGDPANDPACNYLSHLFAVDQTLHWANPPATGCAHGTPDRTDCETLNPDLYTGPVPMVTHVHGSHVNAESDGYPEAWWLPAANDVPAGYSNRGTIFTEFNITNGGPNTTPGSAFYSYENDQPATTLWYHDHTLGMTRLNVYAGPAGFWLIRGGFFDGATDGVSALSAVLPGPAPVDGAGDPNFDPTYRSTLREIPIVIQDRSFNSDGSLFYPDAREFFDGYTGPFIGDPAQGSDIAPYWNPEAFFNTMVVNGTTWPELEVAPALYRFRLLNGCNSRFINLSMFEVILPNLQYQPGNDNAPLGQEIPFWQIGGDQGFLPRVTRVQTGSATPHPGTGKIKNILRPNAHPDQALLLTPAERADVIVDFRGLPDGTVIRMINTAPDAPFGGFPDDPADQTTSGQVMQFRVNSTLTVANDALTTPPENLQLSAEPTLVAVPTNTRKVTLNEGGSEQVCVSIAPDGTITTLASSAEPDPGFDAACLALGGEPMGPKEALLGIVRWDSVLGQRVSRTKEWMDPITENPALNATEDWEVYNITEDAHPIHLHLVRFEVIARAQIDPATMAIVPGSAYGREVNERGYKDTFIVYPSEMARIRATFDREGLYVWHCHIVEHEDNEMMRPYYVGNIANSPVP